MNQPAVKQEPSKDEIELEELRDKINSGESVEDPTEPAPLAEESAPSEQEPETKADEPKEQEPGDKQSSVLSDRATNRYRDLANKKNEAEDRAKKAEEERDNLYKLVDTLRAQGYSQDQATEIAQDQVREVSPQEYEQAVSMRAANVVDQRLREVAMNQQQIRQAELFQEDLGTVEKEYAVLNPDSPDFDPDFERLVGEVYQSKIEKNPHLRLKDLAKEIVEIRDKAVEKARKTQVHKIARQASQQAISPSGDKTTSGEDSIQQKLASATTDADLETIKEEIAKLNP